MIRLRFGARPWHWRHLIQGFESGLIQRVSLGHLSHVDTIMPDGRLLGARADGVHLRLPGYARFKNVVIAEIPATEAQEQVYHEFLLEQVNKPYDNLALMAFLFNREWHHEDKWTCSELPAAGLMRTGHIPGSWLRAAGVTVVNLHMLVRMMSGVMVRAEPDDV